MGNTFPPRIASLVFARKLCGPRAPVSACWPGHCLGSLLWGLDIVPLKTSAFTLPFPEAWQTNKDPHIERKRDRRSEKTRELKIYCMREVTGLDMPPPWLYFKLFKSQSLTTQFIYRGVPPRRRESREVTVKTSTTGTHMRHLV